MNYEVTPAKTRIPANIASKNYKNIVYGVDSVQQAMDVYLPANRDRINTPVIIFLHAGAWIMGDKSQLDGLDSFFNENNCAVINMNYRLDSQYKYPAPLDDIDSVVSYLHSHAAEWQVNPDKVCLFGFSAGGHLALMYAYSRNTGKFVKAVIDNSGPSNLTDSNSSASLQNSITVLLGSYNANKQLWHDASPVYYAKTAVPTVIIGGTADPLVFFSQSQELYDSLMSYSVPTRFIPLNRGGHVMSMSDWLAIRLPVIYWIKNFL